MADEIKIRETGGAGRTESLYNRQSVKRPERKSDVISSEKTQISEEARILQELVPKVLSRIEKEREDEPRSATNADVAKALTEELIKALLAKKFIE